ncbi:Disease resistance protein RPP13 [Rhynchospora pubera]|uniref:Disease resistance protein RPP13 n=1 Tax=Rhynchospora pubera TaxID=906938 RepID=A0AAV8CSX3_9POAL|nr:Disease resistance protein RPP13 [Rhynchospora pubera]
MANCVVELVKEYAVKEAEALAEMGDKIMVLTDRLEWLQTFIRDADQKRRSNQNPFVAVWVRQTRDVAFQVEDVIDEYLRKSFLAEIDRSDYWNGFFKCITDPITQFWTLHDLRNRMNKIEQRLIEISKNKDDYNIQSAGEPSSVWTSSSTTNLAAWDNMEEDMIGFDDYEKKLENLLTAPGTDSDSLAIISILGESGSGKTKLTRKIYDCEAVQKHFVIRCWILLPPKYRVTEILNKIHKKVQTQVPHQNKVQSYAGNDICEVVRDELDEGRYLLVLDGMAGITDWNSIKAALPDLRNASRVVLIMRSDCEGVEQFVDHPHPELKIDRLNEEMSKRVFLKRVFRTHSYPSWFDENTYGKDVFTLTQGLPLAIVILAGLLRSKESQAEWDSQFKQLKDERGMRALGRILAMSFDDLPHSLKSCFLYLGALPETKLHDGNKLVRLWISEGFIKPKKGKTLEEIGQQHLKELVSRCLVQLLNKDAEGNVQFISIHGPVHAFAQSESHGANFFTIHDNLDVLAPSTVRRLSVQNHTDKYIPLKNSFPKLRSLVCNFSEEQNNTKVAAPQTNQNNFAEEQDNTNVSAPQTHQSNFSQEQDNTNVSTSQTHQNKFAEKQDNTKVSAPQTNQKSHTLRFLHASKFLRVIDLQGLRLESLPNEVGSMIHLRYLGVKNCGLKQLPASIGNLIYLQTFDVQDTDASNITEEFWNIPTLRHIFTCKMKPPITLKSKDNLQTLHGIDCSSWNTALLEKAMNLRSLELEGLSNLHMEALLVALRKLELLVHLRLKCSKEASIPSGIFNISILRHLQGLEIDGKLEKAQGENSMQSYSSTLPNLTKLILRNSSMSQEFIFMLAKFPRLSFFKLEYSSYSDKKLVFPENGFRGLEELHLSLDKLVDWRIEKSVMPELAKLYFWQCKSMEVIPDGMRYLRNLKEVMVYHSHKIAKRIKEGGDDYRKVEHVPIIRVRWKQAEKNKNPF